MSVQAQYLRRVQPGLRPLARPALSQGRARNPFLPDLFSARAGRRFLREPGRRSQPANRRRKILRARRRRPPQAGNSARRQAMFTPAKTAGRSAGSSPIPTRRATPRPCGRPRTRAAPGSSPTAPSTAAASATMRRTARPLLGDTLAMGQAFIDLYAATGERDWLRKAAAAGRFIGANFEVAKGGFLPTKSAEAAGWRVPSIRRVQLDDQTRVARFMNLLHRYTGDRRNLRTWPGTPCVTPSALPRSARTSVARRAADRHGARRGACPHHHRRPQGRCGSAKARPRRPRLSRACKRLDWWDVREGRSTIRT